MYNIQSKKVKARIDFYDQQATELIQLVSDLSLARQVVKEYSSSDWQYYLEMERYLQSKFSYVLPNALSFVPTKPYSV